MVERSYAAIPAPCLRDRNYSYPISHQSSILARRVPSPSCVWECASAQAVVQVRQVRPRVQQARFNWSVPPTPPSHATPNDGRAAIAEPPQPHPLISTARTGSERFFAFVNDQELIIIVNSNSNSKRETETEIDQLFAAVHVYTCFTSKHVFLACSDETNTTFHVEICHGEGKYDFYYIPI